MFKFWIAAVIALCGVIYFSGWDVDQAAVKLTFDQICVGDSVTHPNRVEFEKCKAAGKTGGAYAASARLSNDMLPISD